MLLASDAANRLTLFILKALEGLAVECYQLQTGGNFTSGGDKVSRHGNRSDERKNSDVQEAALDPA